MPFEAGFEFEAAFALIKETGLDERDGGHGIYSRHERAVGRGRSTGREYRERQRLLMEPGLVANEACGVIHSVKAIYSRRSLRA